MSYMAEDGFKKPKMMTNAPKKIRVNFQQKRGFFETFGVALTKKKTELSVSLILPANRLCFLSFKDSFLFPYWLTGLLDCKAAEAT